MEASSAAYRGFGIHAPSRMLKKASSMLTGPMRNLPIAGDTAAPETPTAIIVVSLGLSRGRSASISAVVHSYCCHSPFSSSGANNRTAVGVKVTLSAGMP